MFLLNSCTIGLFCLEEVHPKFRDRADIRWTLVSRIRNVLRGRGYEGTYTSLGVNETDMELLSPASLTEAPEEPEAKHPSGFTRQVKLQILSIAIQGFVKVSTLAIVPVFLATPSQPDQPQNPTRGFEVVKGVLGTKGRFGLNTISTSNVLLSQAAAAIGGQILLVPAIISRHGPLHSYRVVGVILLCLYCLLPLTANWTTWAGMPTMLIILWVYAVASGLATTCSAILYVFPLKFGGE